MTSLRSICCDSVNTYILSKHELTDIEKIRVKYGTEMFYLSLSKIIVVAVIATMFGVLPGLILSLISFNLIKSAAFGLHAKSSLQCLLMSIAGFILLPMICLKLQVNMTILHVVTALLPAYFYCFAPSDTKKRPLVGPKTRAKLKLIVLKRALMMCMIILIIPNNYFKVFLLGGLVTQAVLNCPITYYLMKEKRRNYEELERGYDEKSGNYDDEINT